MRRIAGALCACAVALAALGGGLAAASGGAAALERYVWTEVRPTTPASATMWAPRAGLQAVEVGNAVYVLGGRGPFSPFGTQLYADVWRTLDRGATWARTADGAWPARGYFGLVQRDGEMILLGGQNFRTAPNPGYPLCPGLPPGAPCLPFVPDSTFFDDVWSSRDGATWSLRAAHAGWAGRAGLAAVVHRGEIFVLGGSRGDDASTGGTGRVLFNDVWKSSDGRAWTQVTAAAPWAPRAGGAVVTKGGYLYLLGGERGFTCGGAPGCVPERDLYFNDVWRSRDGARWELVTPHAGWSPRPGHQCVVVVDQIVCFGGYGEPVNPSDVWTSRDGGTWTELPAPAAPPWNGGPDAMKYDFDALAVTGRGPGGPAIMTFGGDRERFELPPFVNAQRLDNDVWRFSAP